MVGAYINAILSDTIIRLELDTPAPTEGAATPSQQTSVFLTSLPYWPQLSSQLADHFSVLKQALGHAIQCEATDSIGIVVSDLMFFVRRYKKYFSKQDHVLLIQLLYEMACRDPLPPHALSACLLALVDLLLPQKLLSRSDLTLEWRPLYDLYLRVKKESICRMHPALWGLLDPIVQLAVVSSCYFPPTATLEILQELYPQIHPSLSSNTYMLVLTLLTAFLPVDVAPDVWGLWFDDLIKLWLGSGLILPKGEGRILNLLSRLAPRVVGRIDWSPHLHQLFDQLLRSVHIPVGPLKFTFKSRTVLPIQKFSKIIVFSICPCSHTLSHLRQLMLALETFFHPSNDGKHLKNLIMLVSTLVAELMLRLAIESGAKAVPASLQIPPEFHLSDSDVDEFVTAVLPSLRLALFTKEEKNQFQVAACLGSLSTIRPRLFVPEIIEEAKEALVSVTEPHRLTSLLSCLYSVSACLTTAVPDFPEGRTYVIPLLHAILPGIDVNDAFKTALSLKVITQLISGIPLVDCSKCPPANATGREVAAQTALFEDFLLEFISKMFHFLQCATTSITLGELEGMQTGPHIHSIDAGFSLQSNIILLFPISLAVVLSSCPLALYERAVSKIFQLTCGMFASIDKPGTSPYPVILSHLTACEHGEDTAKIFFSHCLQCITRVTSELQLEKEERGDPEIKWNLELLSAVVQYGARHTLSHLSQIREVLRLTRYARCKEIYQMSAGLLCDVITCLSGTYILPKYLFGVDLNLPPGERDYLSDWGTYFKKNEVRAKWHVPSHEEIEGVNSLLHEFLQPELDRIKLFVSGSLELSRDELQNLLTFVESAFLASSFRYLHTTEPPLSDYEHLITPDLVHLTRQTVTCNQPTYKLESYKMDELCPLIHSLSVKLFSERQHETESLRLLVSVIQSLLSPSWAASCWSQLRLFKIDKHILSVRKDHRHRYSQLYLLHRLESTHDCVGLEDHVDILTASKELLLIDLFHLATSEYVITRQYAQYQLDKCFTRYLFSRRFLFPHVLPLLGGDTPRERLKGVLRTLLYNKNLFLEYICCRPDLLCELVPALLSANHTDKQPIIDLLYSIFSVIRQLVGLLDPLCARFSSETQRAALERLGVPLPPDTLETALQVRESKRDSDMKAYTQFVSDLVQFIRGPTSSLFFEFAVSILSSLPHPSLPRPPEMVPTLLPLLTHDTVSVRYTAMSMLERIIKFKRHPFKKVKLVSLDQVTKSVASLKLVPSDDSIRLEFGECEENKWLCINEGDVKKGVTTEEEWNAMTFVDKMYIGYARPWPRNLEIFAPAKDQSARTEFDLEDKQILSWFSEETNVKSMTAFLSLEERKNAEEFRIHVEGLFKALGKNYGAEPLKLFTDQLSQLITSQQETEQRLGLEVAAGILMGSKHWQWREVSELESIVAPAFFQGVRHISKETSPIWATFLSRILFNRDPKRFLWLWKGLQQDLMDPSDSCFTNAMRLLLCDCAVFYGSWRVPGIKHTLLSQLAPHLSSPYQMLRSRIARFLVTLFAEEGPLAVPLFSPSRQQFLSKLGVLSLAQGTKLSSLEGVPRDELLCEIKVIAEFLTRTAKLLKFAPELLLLGETVLAHRNAIEEDELTHLLDSLAHSLSLLEIPKPAVPTLISVFQKMPFEENWQTKLGKLFLFQVLTFGNLFTVLSHGKLVVSSVTQVLLALLADQRVEVRDQAADSLSGMVRCGFYSNKDVISFVEEFKEQLGPPPQGRRAQKRIEPSLLTKKHSGLLGLGAVVLAFPYSIPPLIPEVLMLVGAFLQATPPLQETAKHVLSEFKRTHWDQWEVHRAAFSDVQLGDLRGMLVSPTYYV